MKMKVKAKANHKAEPLKLCVSVESDRQQSWLLVGLGLLSYKRQSL